LTEDPPTPIAERKRQLRARIRPLLAALAPADRASGSDSIRTRLAASPEFQRARRILAFVPLPSEPDLLPLLQQANASAQVFLLPRWDPATGEYLPAELPPGGQLVTGPHGVPEPPTSARSAAHEPLDLILVPGLAFDRQGRRLGRGRGFYDRLLSRSGGARRWGVAFDLQLVDEVPSEAHDVNLDLLATPALWLPIPTDAPAGPR
jgi:5-formyltetrahydrofolate cyclo-ligase